MPKQRDPKREEAFEVWKKHNGDITNRAIAEQLDVPEKTISAWKSRDKWNAVLQKEDCSTTNGKTPKNARSPGKKETVEPIVESDELTERQRLFCLYYVKTFNATQSAIKAGYSAETAHVQGSRLLGNVKVASEIKRIKSDMTHDLFLDAMDVLQKWVKIAFADITDYVSFGQREQQVIGMYGPVFEKDEYGDVDKTKPLMETVNYVDLKESSSVDGSLVTEVKQGKDGISVKLADKMKALEKLSLYFDLFPDNFKRKIETERLELEKQKISGEGNTEDQLIDDWVNAVMDDE